MRPRRSRSGASVHTIGSSQQERKQTHIAQLTHRTARNESLVAPQHRGRKRHASTCPCTQKETSPQAAGDDRPDDGKRTQQLPPRATVRPSREPPPDAPCEKANAYPGVDRCHGKEVVLLSDGTRARLACRHMTGSMLSDPHTSPRTHERHAVAGDERWAACPRCAWWAWHTESTGGC